MTKATDIMSKKLQEVSFKTTNNILISNVTADEIPNSEELKNLLIKQIEKDKEVCIKLVDAFKEKYEI